MNAPKLTKEVEQYVAMVRGYGFDSDSIALDVIHMTEGRGVNDVREALLDISDDIFEQILLKISAYKKTGEYFIISSTGVTKDVSQLMGELSKIVDGVSLSRARRVR